MDDRVPKIFYANPVWSNDSYPRNDNPPLFHRYVSLSLSLIRLYILETSRHKSKCSIIVVDAMRFAGISNGSALIIKGFYAPVNNFLIKLLKNCARGDR
jgi:hypothetical protein